MRAILQYLARRGGVASLAELMANGHDMRTIWLHADYGRHLFRVCKGIYAISARPRRAQARNDVVIHWSWSPFSGTRAAVTVDEARRQAARCRVGTPDTL